MADSITALIWIDNKVEWKQFVKHRVEEILKTTTSDRWPDIVRHMIIHQILAQEVRI